jgi:hypothetical protein
MFVKQIVGVGREVSGGTVFCDGVGTGHGLINYTDTKAKCRLLKKLPVKAYGTKSSSSTYKPSRNIELVRLSLLTIRNSLISHKVYETFSSLITRVVTDGNIQICTNNIFSMQVRRISSFRTVTDSAQKA